MNALLMDIAYCMRRLAHAPGFTTIAIGLLGLAFAVNAPVFNVAWTLLYRPLPFPAAEALVRVDAHLIRENMNLGVTPPLLDLFARDSRAISGIVGFRAEAVSLKSGDGESLSAMAFRVEPKLFALLGLHPLAGRLLTRDDAPPSGPWNVLVSQGFAVDRYGGVDGALGKTIDAKEGSYRIVGVMPVDVPFARGVPLWLPLVFGADDLDHKNDLIFGNLQAIARLAPGVSVADAKKELTSTASTLPGLVHDIDAADHELLLSPLRSFWIGGSASALNLLLLSVLLILIVAGANVCNLYLARLSARRHESAMLATLGATPARRLRLLLIESTMLTGAGAAIGILSLPAGLKLLDYFGLLPQNTPFAPGIDVTLIGYLIALAAILAFVMALAGFKLQDDDSRLHDLLRQGGSRQTAGGAARRTRAALIVAQIALTSALLIGAGLLIQSAHRLLNEDTGFDREHLIVTRLDSDPEPAAFRSAMLALRDRIAALPGVDAVGTVDWPPFTGQMWIKTIWPSDQAGVDTKPPTAFIHRNVDPGYFAAMGQPILSGRPFNGDETKSELPVVIVDTDFVHRYFANGDAVGRHFRIDDDKGGSRELTIVGVVSTVKLGALDENLERASIYLPGPGGPWLAIRCTIDPAVVERSLSRIAHDAVPGGKLGLVASMREQIAATVRDRIRLNQLLELLAAVALILASVGLYAVMAYSVRTRTNEFGVRLALGAPPARVHGEVLVQGLRLIGLGLAIGLPLAYAFTRLIASQLYRTSPFDPATLAAVTLLIAAVGLLASWWPARGASRIDPMTALRAD